MKDESIIKELNLTKEELIQLFKHQSWNFDEENDEVFYVYDLEKTRGILFVQNHDLDDEIAWNDIKFDIDLEYIFDSDHKIVDFKISKVTVTGAYDSDIVYIENFVEIFDTIHTILFHDILEILHKAFDGLDSF